MRRFRRPPYRALVVGLVLVVLLLARLFRNEPPVSTPGRPPAAGSHQVVRVVDGDTILFAANMRVRLIGVNTPETVKPDSPVGPWGPEASAFTRKFLTGGTAQLEFDRERYDQYGRFLAYVWVGDRMLNEELLRAGLARWERNYNYSIEKKARFRAAQEEARRAGRGIWLNEPAPVSIPRGAMRAPREVERATASLAT